MDRLPARCLSFHAALIALFAVGAWATPSPVEAATLAVSNCNDSGPGSLRALAATAASGDTLDLRALSCTRLNVTSGHIVVPQSSLRILGGGRTRHTLRGDGDSRVLLHTGTGTLRLEQLSVSYGGLSGTDALGGCVHSSGNVELRGARVHHCTIDAPLETTVPSGGGGVHANGNVLLSDASVFRNSVFGGGFLQANGGGVHAGGRVTLQYAQVYENIAGGSGGGIDARDVSVTYSLLLRNRSGWYGGGARGTGALSINKSTFAENHAYYAGAVYMAPGAGARVVADSTITHNRGDGDSSGVLVEGPGQTEVLNSTIADNEEGTQSCYGALNAQRIRLVSTLLWFNVCTAGEPDIGLPREGGPGEITGSNNLLFESHVAVPADTISRDPNLLPLADNGGPVRTRALPAGSPALDRGANPLNRGFDQRGPGFPRVKNGQADIGAYER